MCLVQGGTVNIDAASVGGNVSSTVLGNFTMTSGTLNLDSTPSGADAPLVGRQQFIISGNFQVKGSTLSDPNYPFSDNITLNGLSNYLYLTAPSNAIPYYTLN